MRPIYWVLLALAVLTGGGVLAMSLWQERSAARQEVTAKAERGRKHRATAAVMALAPLPAKKPLVDRPVNDEHGYPRSYVDKAGLRALLTWKKYDALNQYIEEFQRDFLADFRREYWINDASDAFGSAEPELGKQLDAWVAATPGSFAPYLARGTYHVEAGYAARGAKLVRDTHSTDFEEMRKAFALAESDLQRALALSPRLVPAMRHQMRIVFTGNRRVFPEIAAKAFETCPGCMQLRVTHQIGLEPRWGGSYRAMEAAARAAPVSLNSRLRQLPGYSEIDRATDFVRDGQLERALEHAERACKLGDNADFLSEKADILLRMKDPTGAKGALTQALELRPNRSALLFDRARAASREDKKDWRAAFDDLVQGLRISPTSSEGRSMVPTVVKGLTHVGWQAHKQGKAQEALELLDRAAELDPNPDVESRRVAVLTSGFTGTDAELSALEKEMRAAPDDFYVRLRYDYALSTRQDWPRIAAMWNDYIKRHPEDARAYLERAGTHHHLGHMKEAYEDAQRACDLGSGAGCNLARR